MKSNHVTLMRNKLCLAFFRIINLCFRITIFHNMFQGGIRKWIEQRSFRLCYQLFMRWLVIVNTHSIGHKLLHFDETPKLVDLPYL